MKGKYPHAEIDDLKNLNKGINFTVKKLDVPGLNADRHAVIISK